MYVIVLHELELDAAMLDLELAEEQLRDADGLKATWRGIKAVSRASGRVYVELYRYLRAVAVNAWHEGRRA